MKESDTIRTRSGIHLRIQRHAAERQPGFTLRTDCDRACVLHWGLRRTGAPDWQLPPSSNWPSGTKSFDQKALQTPLPTDDGEAPIVISLPPDSAYTAVEFVLFFPDEGRWDNNGGGNYRIELGRSAPAPELLADEIIQAEMGDHSWTLMHRFNLCHDMLDRVRGDVDALALLFVWLRFSAIRQLTWQRKYNTKPRELSHAQDRLTHKLAELYRSESESRLLLRWMLRSVGRGGEGQKIRDEILSIMHRHHIKEVASHFMEEWHQKLHNNTTPDDIVICEAYLEFFRSDGNLDRFYRKLQVGGVTQERLAGFERPIKSDPIFIPHLKDGLIHDFQNFLRILKSIHAGTDLETSIQAVREQLDTDTRERLSHFWHHRNDPDFTVIQLVEEITEVRRRLQEPLCGGSQARDWLYLDLALEEFVRTLVERNIHLQWSGGDLVELTAQVLTNLTLSNSDPELAVCSRHWNRLKDEPHFERDWSLHAKSVLDRIGRVLGSLIDQAYQLLQPKAEWLGHAFQAEPWSITLFSEEIVRGGSLDFVLSRLLHHLDPVLRRCAQLGHWQIISRGSGTGEVEVVDSLRSVQGKAFDRPMVIVADQVKGDEEVPEGIAAVIAPDVMDIVSHVAVRARNANLLFATCYDPTIFQRLKSLRGRRLHLEVNPGGDVVWTETAKGAPSSQPAARPERTLSEKRPFSRYAVAEPDFDEHIVGAKSFNQARLRQRLPDGIHQPASAAIPFGVFEQVLALDQNKTVAQRYAELLGEVDIDLTTTLPKLRETVLALSAPPELIDALREAMQQAEMPWPENRDQTWNCIKKVWASKWNERAVLSRRAQGVRHDDLFMAVLIQQIVDADYAFVIHTTHPATGNPNELYAEVVLGLGETLVANYPGRALSFTWDKENSRETMLTYPAKRFGLYGGGLIFRSDSNAEDLKGYAGAGLYDSVMFTPPKQVLLDYSEEPLIWNPEYRHQVLRTIAQAGLAAADAIGSPQDVEGAWKDGRCHIVQTRPQVGIDHD